MSVKSIILGLLAAGAAGVAAPASAAASCSGVDTRLTPERQTHFAPIVASMAGDAAGARVTGYGQEGAWIFVHATFATLEPAFFFFRTEGGAMHYVDLWAGFTVEEERAEDIAWARGIGLPERLAACFAEAAIGG